VGLAEIFFFGIMSIFASGAIVAPAAPEKIPTAACENDFLRRCFGPLVKIGDFYRRLDAGGRFVCL
jgi:hypothetical protein